MQICTNIHKHRYIHEYTNTQKSKDTKYTKIHIYQLYTTIQEYTQIYTNIQNTKNYANM